MRSIICNNKDCYICGKPNGEEHHIFKGNGFRGKSERYGLKVHLCYEHHRGTAGVHGRDGHELDMYLKRVGQLAFENTHSREDWMKIFKRNYLG